MSINRDVRHAKKRALEQLTALRDEAKLQLHLLSRDARQRWDELEKQVDELEVRAAREGEKAAEGVKGTVHELTRIVSDFMAKQLNHASGLATAVRAIMSSHVRACHASDTLNQAANLMWDGDCGAVPVVADDGTAVGIVTDRDICMATYTQSQPPQALSVERAMSKELRSCSPDDSVGRALTVMADKRLRRLAVVDPAGKLVGMLALADVARWAHAIANPDVDAALVETLAAISAFTPEKIHAAAE